MLNAMSLFFTMMHGLLTFLCTKKDLSFFFRKMVTGDTTYLHCKKHNHKFENLNQVFSVSLILLPCRPSPLKDLFNLIWHPLLIRKVSPWSVENSVESSHRKFWHFLVKYLISIRSKWVQNLDKICAWMGSSVVSGDDKEMSRVYKLHRHVSKGPLLVRDGVAEWSRKCSGLNSSFPFYHYIFYSAVSRRYISYFRLMIEIRCDWASFVFFLRALLTMMIWQLPFKLCVLNNLFNTKGMSTLAYSMYIWGINCH